MLLLTAVRRYVNVSVLKAFAPTNAWVEALRADAWADMVASARGISPGRIETVCNEAIARQTALAKRIPGFAMQQPANDVQRLATCRRCGKPVRPGDQGEWTKFMHGACENAAVTEALTVSK